MRATPHQPSRDLAECQGYGILASFCKETSDDPYDTLRISSVQLEKTLAEMTTKPRLQEVRSRPVYLRSADTLHGYTGNRYGEAEMRIAHLRA